MMILFWGILISPFPPFVPLENVFRYVPRGPDMQPEGGGGAVRSEY